MMIRVAIGMVLSLLAFYLGDDAIARSRPMGTVQVQPFYAIHKKNGKIEFDYNVPVETQNCVASVLPHAGSNPCWYVSRHPTRKIEI
jgi:hypothetical protein